MKITLFKMHALKNNNLRSLEKAEGDCKHRGFIFGSNHPKENIAPLAFFLRSLLAVLFLQLIPLDFVGISCIGPTTALGIDFEINPVDQIRTNADGLSLRFPLSIFYDNEFEELYVSDIGRSQVVIYAKDDYPLISFSKNRGITGPRCIYIDHNGMIYIGQNFNDEKPNRITVLNGAFIVVREIPLNNIPGVNDFEPAHVAVNRDGIIYVTSRLGRGVLVLDNDGNFLRWLRPTGEVPYLSQEELDTSLAEQEKANTTAPDEENGEPAEPTIEPESAPPQGGEIPEEFRPKYKRGKRAQSGPTIGPVVVTSVTIDTEGRLYLVSPETCNIYVYSPDETFLFSFGRKGGGPRTLSTPRGLAVDEKRGLLYVVDFMRHTILVYDRDDGHFLFEFGGKGTGLGWFAYPNDIIVDKERRVIVSDLFNHRVQVLSVKYERDISQVPQTEEQPEPQNKQDLIEVISEDGGSMKTSEVPAADTETEDEVPLGLPDKMIEEEIIKATSPGELPDGQLEPLDATE